MQKFTIDGELCDLNTYISSERGNRFAAAKIKKDQTKYCAWFCKSLKLIEGKSFFIFEWFVKNAKKDPDNLSFGAKAIFDSLVETGKLENDGQKQVGGILHLFAVDAISPRVEVTILPFSESLPSVLRKTVESVN